MPYFIYQVTPQKKCTLVESHQAFRDSRQRARELRGQLKPGDSYLVKVVFAKNPEEAVQLLTTEREFIPMGDD